MAVIRWWLKRPPGRLEKYLSSTMFPYHVLAATVILSLVYQSTTFNWMSFGP